MALIDSISRCAICRGSLDRPYTATSGCAFPREHRLHAYCDAALHFDCLAKWPDRQKFSKGYFIRAFAYHWRGGAPLLAATARWFLGSGPPIDGGRPHYAVVRLRDWPFKLYSSWTEWTPFVNEGYRRELVGPALDAAVGVMSEVREIAPTVHALEDLFRSIPARTPQLLSYEAQ
jgi:hypothetical protein